MNILGITYSSHDSSATMIVDGQVVAIAEEERFTRRKHDFAFPRHSVRCVLDAAGLSSRDVDVVALPYRLFNGFLRRAWYGVKNFRKAKSFLPRNIGYELLLAHSFEAKLRGEFRANDLPLAERCRIEMYEHHLCHAASAYLASPHEDALIISWDGRGEWPCILYALGEGPQIRVLDKCYFPDSIGQVYQAVTQYLGFADIGDEYKVMGLAPYGSPTYLDVFRAMLRVDGWKVTVDQGYMNYHIYNRHMADRYSMRLAERLGPPRRPSEPIERRHQDVAASLQCRVNEIGVAAAAALRAAHPRLRNLCLTGGVAQNIIMNHHIYEQAGYDDVFVGPASYDGGLSLGAALLTAHRADAMKDRFVMRHAAWGQAFSTAQIETELRSYHIPHVRPRDVVATTARLLGEGKVVGWFQGRAEFGPRALGNRSILADPRQPAMKDIVNRKIKFREEFRPFAPSVLAERFSEFFEGCPPSPFMTFSARVKKGAPPIPAVTHVDGSARPQAVSEHANLRYWRVIKAFEALTGVPVVLNTSFNVKGEPIVNAPVDAIRCFFSTGLDYLVLEDVVVGKGEDASRLPGYERA
ncbi:MAG TPA: carbamoyltransferase C-terminal domain-containing protein [Methylomirabilota bacterium]|nr:carbamoyltransferase C-terminal domain-containing protein [Methylomirabilota bacterium]